MKKRPVMIVATTMFASTVACALAGAPASAATADGLMSNGSIAIDLLRTVLEILLTNGS